MAPENVVPERRIGEFVARLQQAAGPNLESVILYGSAVSGEYDPEYSNVNLLCVLKDTALSNLLALAPSIERWGSQSDAPPSLVSWVRLGQASKVVAMEAI